MEQTEAEAYNYQTKKQNPKIQSTTSIDQLKFNKNEDFYKAKINLKQIEASVVALHCLNVR